MEESGIKTTISSQICSAARLPCIQYISLTVQLYSIVTSNQRDANTFNYSKPTPGMLNPSLSTQINLQQVFKMSAFGMYACFESHATGQ